MHEFLVQYSATAFMIVLALTMTQARRIVEEMGFVVQSVQLAISEE